MFKKIFFLLLSLIVLLSFNSVNAEIKTSNTTIDESKIVNYEISYFDKTVGGNVLKNSKILKNAPKKSLTNEIISMSKKRSVIVKLGDGNGSKILISAGIHGNEAAANIATLRFLETIKNKKIKGTIYIIPFAIPKNTAMDKREWYNPYKKYYMDPNRCANIPNTPAYKIANFAKKNNIKFIIDVHSGGGVASCKRGFIFANKKPLNSKEKQWINYIKKDINPVIHYNNVKKGYTRTYTKYLGISTLTLEVERDKGSVLYWAKIQQRLILSACKFFKLF